MIIDGAPTDKNRAVLDYLIQCPAILNSPLYFNFIKAEDDTNQFITESNDVYTNTRYIDGSVLKVYTFTIITYKSIRDIPVAKYTGYPNENLSELFDAQALIDWIAEQEELHNYPDFGSECEMDSIRATSENPKFEGINEEITPNLAIYSVSIEIRYLDNSKKLWR